MKKTCMNCSHFHGYLGEEEPFSYHIHNYCDAWDKTQSCPMHSIINDFLNYLPCSLTAEELKEAEVELGTYDDIETGEAGCYRFEPANERRDDDFFRRHFEHNKKLAIFVLRKILRENKQLIDSFCPLKDDFIYKEEELNEDDRKEYQELLEKIEATEFGD